MAPVPLNSYPRPNPLPADRERAKAKTRCVSGARPASLSASLPYRRGWLSRRWCRRRHEAAEGEVEVVEAGDFAAADFDDHVAAFEAGLIRRAAGADALDGVAFHLAAEVGDAAEVGAAALAFDAGVPLHFDIFRRFGAFVGVGDDLLDQVDDAVHARDVDLGPLIGRAVVVGMRAREEVQHGDFLAVERRLVARPKAFRLEDQVELVRTGRAFSGAFPSAGRCRCRRR